MKKWTPERQAQYDSLLAARQTLLAKRSTTKQYSTEWLDFTRHFGKTHELLREVFNVSESKLQRFINGEITPQQEWERINVAKTSR